MPTARGKGSRQALACATGVVAGPASFLAFPLATPTASVARAGGGLRDALATYTKAPLRVPSGPFAPRFRLRLHRGNAAQCSALRAARLRRWAHQRPAASYAGAPPPVRRASPPGSAPAWSHALGRWRARPDAFLWCLRRPCRGRGKRGRGVSGCAAPPVCPDHPPRVAGRGLEATSRGRGRDITTPLGISPTQRLPMPYRSKQANRSAPAAGQR